MPGMSPNIEREQIAKPADGETLLWAVDQRDARTLNAGLLNDGKNLRFTDGLPGTRKGVVKPGWANKTSNLDASISSLGTPYGSGVFRDPNGQEWQLTACGGYVWRTRPGNQNQSIALPAGVMVLGRCKFVQAFNLVFLFRGQFLAPLVMSDFDDGFADILPHFNSASAYNAAVVATGQAAQEMAYGPWQAVTSINLAGTIATCVTANPHGFITGADITFQGANQAAYNNRFNITVLDDVTFTFAVYGAPASPATGTITCSNMIYYWKALGSVAAVNSVVTVTPTVTVTTSAAHGFTSGQYVTMTNCAQAVLNGTFPITVTGATTFTYSVPGASSGTDGGSGIKARTSVVLAGQSPTSNPEAWTRSYNILPNADTALFTNDLLLVPTAYEPASVDNYATFSGGSYKKVDYIVATNYLDYIHFSFSNELRINAGSADEITDILKFGAGTVLVFKGRSWYVLSNLTSVAAITLDERGKEYGCVGRTACVAGSNAYFLAPKLGVMVIRQSDLGTLLSVNVPLSTPIQKTIDAIDWTQADNARMSAWENKLYLAVPMKSGVPTILVYDFVSAVRLGNNVWETGVMSQGWTPMDTGSALSVLEFHRLTLNGEERHFFLDTAGYVNLMEESDCGDQVAAPGVNQGLAWQEIETYALSRAYDPSLTGLGRPVEECISLMTFNPTYSARLLFAGVGLATTLVSAKTCDNTRYSKPFDAGVYDISNVNGDWAKPYRKDYHVKLPPNVVPAGLTYLGRPLEAGVTVTPGKTYTYIPGPNDGTLIYNTVANPTGVAITSGQFTPSGATGGTVTLLQNPSFPNPMPVTAYIGLGLHLTPQSTVQLLQYQESLDTRRAAGRQGKSFQLEFTNTTGRVKLVGQRISAVPGRNRRGVLN